MESNAIPPGICYKRISFYRSITHRYGCAAMNLQQLRYLHGIAEQGFNISRAAGALHTSQPGISKQIRLLEQEIGKSVRRGRAFEPPRNSVCHNSEPPITIGRP